MDWKQLGEQVAKLGLPLLGAALPIPGGAALGAALAAKIGSKSADPQDILATLTASSDAVLKAKQFEQTHEETMLKLNLDHELEMRKADSQDIASVNQTMQAENSNSDKEAWYQKAWRPANGFSLAISSFLSVGFICFLFYKAMTSPENGMNVAQVISFIPQLATSIAAILAIPGAAVGVAAWWRGKRKTI